MFLHNEKKDAFFDYNKGIRFNLSQFSVKMQSKITSHLARLAISKIQFLH